MVRQSISGPILRWVSRVEDEIKEPDTSSLHPSTPSAILQLARQKLGAAMSQNGMGSGYSFNPTLMDNHALQASKQPHETLKVSKNYLVYELDQQEGISKPDWSQTMSTVFGTHVNWDEVKVYSGKHRPLCMYSLVSFLSCFMQSTIH